MTTAQASKRPRSGGANVVGVLGLALALSLAACTNSVSPNEVSQDVRVADAGEPEIGAEVGSTQFPPGTYCAVDADCPSNHFCVTGMCGARCYIDDPSSESTCPQGQTCDWTMGDPSGRPLA